MNLFNPPAKKQAPKPTVQPQELQQRFDCGCHHDRIRWKRCPQADALLKRWMAEIQSIQKRNQYFQHYNLNII